MELVINSGVYVALLIMVIIIALWWYKTHQNTMTVKSTFDGRNYNVIKTTNTILAQNSAEVLASINGFATQLINSMKDKYLKTGGDIESSYHSPANATVRLAGNYRPEAVKENFPVDLKFTSYVLNKGDEIAFCLHPANEPKKFHDFNTLQFVVLHELTHLICVSTGHPLEFWKAFKMLLKEAVSAGLYEPVDYSKHPVVYCGVRVTYNPYFDTSLD